MTQVQQAYVWWVGLLVVVVGLALVPLPAIADDNGCVLPGDGVQGTPLHYKVNSNGTIRDRNTRLIWEMKNTTAGSVHYVDNTYTWTATGTDPDGTLFTEFLDTLNNRCERDEAIPCNKKADCAAVGGKCGFAGQRDWRIPHIKELQSIVDYGTVDPAIDPAFDPTAADLYWSSTSDAANSAAVWSVFFNGGFVFAFGKDNAFRARAVRGGCD
jgi:hypothetical protein